MGTWFESINVVSRNNGGFEIVMESCDPPVARPEAANIFMSEIVKVDQVLQLRFAKKEELETLIRDLKDIATVGLGGNNPSISEGQSELQNFKDRIATKWEEEKANYRRRMSLFCVMAFLATLFLFWPLSNFRIEITDYFAAALNGDAAIVPKFLNTLLLTFFGTILGVIVVTYADGRKSSFDSITDLNTMGGSPSAYGFYLAGLSILGLAAFYFKWIELGVGGISLNEVADKPYLGAMIGLFIAFSDRHIVRIILELFRRK